MTDLVKDPVARTIPAAPAAPAALLVPAAQAAPAALPVPAAPAALLVPAAPAALLVPAAPAVQAATVGVRRIEQLIESTAPCMLNMPIMTIYI